jgi:hypothetical protein
MPSNAVAAVNPAAVGISGKSRRRLGGGLAAERQAVRRTQDVQNLLSALVVLLSGCSSTSVGGFPNRGGCDIHPIIGDGLRSSKGVRLSARVTCPEEACRQRIVVTVTVENIANTELLVEPNKIDVFDSEGNRIRRAYPEQSFRCRGPLFSPQMNLSTHDECTIDAILAGAADPSRLREMRVELRGIRRQGNALPMTVIFERECIMPK